jgi:putative lipoprotein (rSAM/lipoprotein system)
MSSEIKKRWFTFQNKSISYILSFLGIGSAVIFNGCMYGSPVVEYGTPHANFKVTGKVTSATGETLSAIKVVMSTDSTRTSSTGEFDVEISDFPEDQEYHVKFIDDDGTQSGGEFVALDTVVKFTDPKFEDGDGDWFSGTASKELNVKLTKKN